MDFREKTGRSLEDFSLSDEVKRKIEAILSDDALEDDKIDESEHTGIDKSFFKSAFRRAKSVFERVFQVIWKFSDFFLPAASSIPFIGSGVSFLAKAVEILISTTMNYRAIFIKAAELFEQVGFFSMRFEVLMEAERAGVQIHHKFVGFISSSSSRG